MESNTAPEDNLTLYTCEGGYNIILPGNCRIEVKSDKLIDKATIKKGFKPYEKENHIMFYVPEGASVKITNDDTGDFCDLLSYKNNGEPFTAHSEKVETFVLNLEIIQKLWPEEPETYTSFREIPKSELNSYPIDDILTMDGQFWMESDFNHLDTLTLYALWCRVNVYDNVIKAPLDDPFKRFKKELRAACINANVQINPSSLTSLMSTEQRRYKSI